MLIPAFQPGAELEHVVSGVQRLNVDGALATVVIVDDGSDAACDAIFQRVGAFPGVTLLRHAVNLGKGAALKTGSITAWSHGRRRAVWSLPTPMGSTPRPIF